MTDPLTTATRIRDALTAYIDAAEALPPEVRALLFDGGGHWTGAAIPKERGSIGPFANVPAWNFSAESTYGQPCAPTVATVDLGESGRFMSTDSGETWTKVGPKVKPEHPDIVKPYRLELLRTTPAAYAGWGYESTFICKDQAIRCGASRAEHRRVFNGARVIDRRTGEVVWEWAKDVDPPTDNP